MPFTKLLFSCLTDADFLDTERFCNPDTKRGMQGDFKQALEILNHRFSELPHATSLQQARSRIQNQAFQNAEHAESIAILDMPTGSGKTLCSLKLALSNAIKHYKKGSSTLFHIQALLSKRRILFPNCLAMYFLFYSIILIIPMRRERKRNRSLQKKCEKLARTGMHH